jgi:NTE family protein
MTSDAELHPNHQQLLRKHLATLFGEIEPQTVEFLQRHLQWIDVPAGHTLIRQGEPGDGAYLTISGRLRAYVRDDSGASRMVREMSRGEVVGELSMYTGAPRSATVVAVRQSVLVKLARQHFEALLATSPRLSVAFTRAIIGRLQTEHQRRTYAAPVTVALLPASARVDLVAFARQLAGELQRYRRVRVLDAASIDSALGVPGRATDPGGEADRQVGLAIDDIESQHDITLLVADQTSTAWTRRCIAHSDELLLLADATLPPELHPVERDCLDAVTEPAEAAETLVLVHPPQTRCPSGTARWLARRPVTAHLHVRQGHAPDIARLARVLARRAVGLVFGGGGARGFAHLGAWRALRARGIEVDFLGGTSIGAAMAALVAADQPIEECIAVARRSFGKDPTGDYNWLPIMSLIKGQRAQRAVDEAIAAIAGGPRDAEDLWKSYFCIATNYSQAREQLISHGPLAKALMASFAIPGALPPVISNGDLVCDGGTFNNFPVDRMRAMRGVGRVIGVDLGGRNPRKIEFDTVPGSGALLLDRLRGRAARRYRLPSLASYLMNITILYSASRQSEAKAQTDVYFNPPLQKIGLLQWSRFDEILRQGEQHANEVLDALAQQGRLAELGS